MTAATVARFRKKPVVIEAIRLGWDAWGAVCDFVGVTANEGDPHGCYITEDGRDVDDFPGEGSLLGLRIPTLEGVMLAVEGDWIIRGVAGEFYPCKPAIFEETYEPVE